MSGQEIYTARTPGGKTMSHVPGVRRVRLTPGYLVRPLWGRWMLTQFRDIPNRSVGFRCIIVATYDQLRNRHAAWSLAIDADTMELVRRYRDWEDRQTASRAEVLAAQHADRDDTGPFWGKLPSALHPGPISLLLQDGRTVELPRFPYRTKTLNSQTFANELNEFLLRR